tara:strand:- start:34 stop:246 length:213 start_codon:yes stop_codon:yes gene_type:complete
MIEIVLDIEYLQVMNLDLEKLDLKYSNRYKKQNLNTYLELTGLTPYSDTNITNFTQSASINYATTGQTSA